MSGPCHFCGRPGELRVPKGESPGAEDVHVCGQCWALLQNPATALPLIRGDLSISLRGTMPEARLKAAIDKYMERIAGFRRPG